ncbi:MAG: hypothetical protein HC895_12840 [Leptolyngbyaceae cyanobacterium SM1_3_5]|nr:hypothetical protein [Leptolyngbyaceae cyanobacterium SM1_3_5]
MEDQPILDEARSIASQGRYSQAIVVASRIQSGRDLHDEARSEIRRWRYQILVAQDRSILRQARALASVDSLTMAIDKASQIPPGRPLYGEAQASIAEWAVRRQEIWNMWAGESGESYGGYDDGYDDSY